MVELFSSSAQQLVTRDVTSERILLALAWWRCSGGVLCRKDERLNMLFPALQIFADTDSHWPPPLLSSGPQCAFRQMFAHGCAGEQLSPLNAGAYGQGFVQVRQSRRPLVEVMRTRLMDMCHQPTWISYQRLIVPGQLSVGGRRVFLVLYEIERSLRALDGGQCP